MAAKKSNGKARTGGSPGRSSERSGHQWYASTVAPILKKLRLAKKLSQQDVADRSASAIHPRMVPNYEAGTEPRLSTFLVLCAALGVDPLELLPKELRDAINRKDAAMVAALVSPTT